MVDYIAWGAADPLTVAQAACLWAGFDPPASGLMLTLPQVEESAIAPRLQMLTGAIISGVLRAETATNALHIIGNHDKSLVKRADLMAFAKGRGERPAFLFDTMLKPIEESSKSDSEPQLKNKGGRPAQWDWNTFGLEIIRIANSPDGLPDTRAELAQIMRKWFIDLYDDHPADTTLEDRIRPIYQYLEQPRKPTGK